MRAQRILVAVCLLAVAGLGWNQWRLHQLFNQLIAAQNSAATQSRPDEADAAAEKLRQAEARLDEARVQLQIAEQKLAAASSRIAQLDGRPQNLSNTRRTSFPGGEVEPAGLPAAEPPPPAGTAKRGWGPEQAVGEPDTLQAGDISTAWAPREQDAGEEWLKLEYEKAVDIAEVRVRETHNPGTISKVTAFLANGSEVTLWEGIEPKALAPVEMSFQIPDNVNAKSVKVYLDTKRIPGWNEIDAVELIGRDGSHQWARQASASSTYAEPRTWGRTGSLGLERL